MQMSYILHSMIIQHTISMQSARYAPCQVHSQLYQVILGLNPLRRDDPASYMTMHSR